MLVISFVRKWYLGCCKVVQRNVPKNYRQSEVWFDLSVTFPNIRFILETISLSYGNRERQLETHLSNVVETVVDAQGEFKHCESWKLCHHRARKARSKFYER